MASAMASASDGVDVTDVEPCERAAPPQLGEDEFVHILWHCGFLSHRLRRVCKLFRRLWSLPATWEGARVTIPKRELERAGHSARAFYEQWIPALGRVAALDSSELMLDLLRHSNSDHHHLYQIFHNLSKQRLRTMPSVNSGLAPTSGWYCPASGYEGVSENVCTRGLVARRVEPRIAGMAAVCGNGPVPRDASGSRSFTLKIEAVDPDIHGGIYVGFVATPPSDINFDDATGLWSTAVMWRLVGTDFYSNVPYANGKSIHAENRLESPSGWSTDQLEVGDTLRITARVPRERPEHMNDTLELVAHRNGAQVVLPMTMTRSAFALELWPYVAVCGRVTSLQLVL